MHETRRAPARSDCLPFPGALVAIIAVAAVLRLGSALWMGNSVTELPGIYDQLSYHGLAERVAAGHGFSFAEGHWPVTRAGEPTAHWSYLYTLYLAAIYALCGVQPLVARVVQAVAVGILHPWLAWRVGRRVFGRTAGLLAAAFSAVYIYFVYYAGGLLTESFYFVGILWTLDAALRIPGRRPGSVPLRAWIELGAAVGVTALLRQVFLVFVPFLFLWVWWSLGRPVPGGPDRPVRGQAAWKRALPGLAVASMVIAALIAPWTTRNYRAFATFVPLNTNAGFAFYWGNHPIHGTRFIPLLEDGRTSYADLIPPELLVLNEGVLDRALLRRALEIIGRDPGRFILLSISRVPEYFKFWPSRDSGTISNLSRVGSFGVFLPLMIYGLWLSVGRVRTPVRGRDFSAVLLLCLFAVVYAGVHLMSWTLVRYRLPVDVVFLLLAGHGGATLVDRLTSRRAVATSPRAEVL